ncbi:VWA domain-containing protein [Hamadaea flava]|uniref:VWA domain-containing protein n=1 Tax=Hamadaea flava TaxID=1742688 RepID=A0ABV8LWE2_9ACTN
MAAGHFAINTGSVPGRHRPPRRPVRAVALVTAVLAVVAASAYAAVRLTDDNASGCAPSGTPIRVAAAPEIADAVRQTISGLCLSAEVTATDPADVSAIIAGQRNVTLAGVGQPDGDAKAPDIWIPDSSTWLARLSNASPTLAATDTVSIARSPVVVAMPEPVAKTLGWPTAKLTWQALLQKMTTDTKLHVGTSEPARDAAALSGLLALGQAASTSAGGQTATTAALRALSAGRSALRTDVLARFPRSAEPAALASGLSAAPMSEQAVLAYNAAKPPVKLAALYLDPAPVALDYPLTVLPGADAGRKQAATQIREALQSDAFRSKLAGAGLRLPDGTPSTGLTLPQGAPTPQVTPPPSATQRAAVAAGVDKALSTWIAVTLPARMLAVIDVSGSMLERVPTAGNATREQVTLEAARRGLGLFDDSWAVGLWTFSTELEGSKDYRQLIPIGPLSTQRTSLLAKLEAIQPKQTGDTGLYDTLLAAYQTVQHDWDPGRVNSIVMMTDGDNDDDNGISHADLLAKLKQLADPKRPIQVIIIGIGPSVNAAPLKQVTDLTGGGVFTAKDPAKIGEIFLQAISLRAAGLH